MCRSSFKGFIASFANFLLQIKYNRKGASESPIVINPYCKHDFLLCWLLKETFLNFVVIESSSGGVVPFAKKLNTDVCFVLF